MWSYGSAYRGQLLGVLVTVLLISGLSVVPPIVIGLIVDEAIGGSDIGLLTVLGVVMIVVPIVNSLVGIAQRWWSSQAGEGIIYDLRRELYEHLQRMSLAFFTSTKTGELITVNFDEIKEGRFSWTADGEEVSVDVSDAESGTVKIESSDGDGFQLTTGDAVTEPIPDWVPVYPGTEPKNRGSMKTDEMVSGNYTPQTEDGADAVLEYFRDTLKTEGYQVNINTYTSDERGGGIVNGSLESEGKTVVVLVNTDGGSTSITVTHSIKK